MRFSMVKIWTFFLLFLGQCVVAAQDTLMVNDIDDIVITATRINTSLLKTPLTLHKISPAQMFSLQSQSLKGILGSTPGVFITNQFNTAQDLRISIRGFGARSAFGIRGVRLMMDGIPLSTPDGQGQVDNVFLGSLKDIEVLNGTASAVWGNASGGVININTFSDKARDSWASITYGSFRSWQANAEFNHRFGEKEWSHQFSYQQTDGFREWSSGNSFIYNGRFKKRWKNGSELVWMLNGLVSPEGLDPGGVNLEMAMENRKAARPQNILYQAGEEVRQLTSGVKYTAPFQGNRKLNVTAFYTVRDFSNKLPFTSGGQVDLFRNYGGVITSYSKKWSSDLWRNELVGGIDVLFQDDFRQRYDNLEGQAGDRSLAQKEIFQNQSAYLVWKSSLNLLDVLLGLRYDRNFIKVIDRFEEDGIQDGEIALPSVSPTLNASYRIADDQVIRLGFSYGFETPTLNELSARPDNLGGFNIDLNPQQSYTYEVGYRAKWRQKLTIDLTLFNIQSRDELLPYELQDFTGRTFYRNAGKTERQGIELQLSAKPIQEMTAEISYTYSDFRFTEFEQLNGNTLPGIPKHQLGFLWAYHYNGWDFYFQHIYQSAIFADNENEVSVPAASFGALKVSKKWGRMVPFITLNNIFGAAYYDNIRINAFGARYYEAAPGRNVQVGVKFEF
ncbi:TonB-dependent receptor family protein [Portibacter marinus]|uniref:TonB-dependent receptor family protein n=1 Tax=Portibacter marinus TaxID=2898660 RepID=UPI001F34B54C|nr:TonB-dependent receptor [Portibacter marinus]